MKDSNAYQTGALISDLKLVHVSMAVCLHFSTLEDIVNGFRFRICGPLLVAIWVGTLFSPPNKASQLGAVCLPVWVCMGAGEVVSFCC